MTSSWIVVGAGSAGCVVAGRLAEAGVDVTLVEDGPDVRRESVAAAIDGADFFAALGVADHVHADLLARRAPGQPPSPYPRGRGVGGSSLLNAMVALWGTDRWRDEIAPAEEWRHARQRVPIPIGEVADEHLGTVDRALLAAEPLARRAELTVADGRRVTSAEAYLWPILDGDRRGGRLTIVSDATVDRVLFDRRRAVGVVLADGRRVEGDAVVVCAGAIHTPAILLRSRVDTPGVGRGLQDHPSAHLTLDLATDAAGVPGRLAVGALAERGGHQLLAVNHVGAAEESRGLGLLGAAWVRPVGRNGVVELVDDDPATHPAVTFDLVGDRRDLDALGESVRWAADVVATPPFREIIRGAYVDDAGGTIDALLDGPGEHFERWLRHAATDYVHASGTCALHEVTDGDGWLRGYERLAVCDASLFPTIPDANTHLPVTALAELLSSRWIARL